MCVSRSKNELIFGGFTGVPWSSSNHDKTDTYTFLFTLKAPDGIIYLQNSFNTVGNGMFFSSKMYNDTTVEGLRFFTGNAHFTCDDTEVFVPI